MDTRSYTATLYYSFELSKKVSSFYTLRQFGTTTALCLIILTSAILVFFWYGLSMPGYQIAASVVVGSVIIYFWYRYEVRRRWLAAMHAMGKPEATLVVDEDAFTVSSGADQARYLGGVSLKSGSSRIFGCYLLRAVTCQSRFHLRV